MVIPGACRDEDLNVEVMAEVELRTIEPNILAMAPGGEFGSRLFLEPNIAIDWRRPTLTSGYKSIFEQNFRRDRAQRFTLL
jgi:hypothetical protein